MAEPISIKITFLNEKQDKRLFERIQKTTWEKIKMRGKGELVFCCTEETKSDESGDSGKGNSVHCH